MKQCYYNLRKETDKLKIAIYEANIDPQLRFMHIRNVLASGWVSIPANKYNFVTNLDDKESSSDIEVNCNWENVNHLDCNDIAPIRQASFDIECYSHEHNKMPIPDVLQNPVIQVGTIIQDFGQPNKFVKHIITLKKCNPIEDAIVVSCNTETELLIKWQELLMKSDPDIIYGYNIFSFDLNYLMVRAKLLGCERFTYLGRMKYIQSFIKESFLSSAAYGDNHFKMVEMPGRLQMDLLQIILRDIKKYPSYKLGYISSQILSTVLKTDPIKCTAGSTKVYIEHKAHDFKPGTVIHLFNIDPCGGYEYEDLNKMHIITEVQENGYYIEMWKKATRNEKGGGEDEPRAFETKHDLSPPELFAKFKSGTPEEITEIAKYCIQDCMLPQKIINKCNILINQLEMAKVTYVPTSFLMKRGQQIKVFSQIAKKARERDYLVHTIEPKKDDDEDIANKAKKEKYQGATVLEPDTGSYWDCVFTLDFEALYPTTEIDHNLCYTSLVKDKKYANLPGVQYLVKTLDNQTYMFAQNVKGLIPEILEHLLNARKVAKDKMANAKTAFEKSVYDGAQLAFKVSCNSVYGFTGCGDTGMLPCKPIAVLTTALGREKIEGAKNYAEDKRNFEDIMCCVEHFPLDYYYLCVYPNGKHKTVTGADIYKWYEVSTDVDSYSVTEEQLSTKPLLVWTSAEFSQVVRFERIKDTQRNRYLYGIFAKEGKVPNMQKYSVKTIYGKILIIIFIFYF